MKNLFIVTMILFCVFNSDIKAQNLVFQKTYSSTGPTNQGVSIIEQQDGSYFVCATRSVPNVLGQYIGTILLIKITANGDTVWTKDLGSANQRELAMDMTQLSNGNLIIVGSRNTPPDASSMNGLVMSVSTNGSILWQKEYGGSEQDYFNGVAVDGNHIVVCGNSETTATSGLDGWILKLNANGDSVWSKTFGGGQFDDFRSVLVDNNQYVVSGGTYSFSSGLLNDAWVVKVDSSGSKIWDKLLGVTDKADWFMSSTLSENNNNVDGYVFTGVKDTEEASPGNINGSLYFVKLDLSGNVVWEKTINGTPLRREGGSVFKTRSDGFYIAGYKLDQAAQSQQMYIIKTNAVGDVLWEKAYGTSDSNYVVNDIVETNTGCVVTGAVFRPNQPIRYIFVAKLSDSTNSIANHKERSESIDIYPNPSFGEFYVDAKNDRKLNSVNVLSLDGKVLKAYKATNTKRIKVNIDIPGVYLLHVNIDDSLVTRRIIVQ